MEVRKIWFIFVQIIHLNCMKKNLLPAFLLLTGCQTGETGDLSGTYRLLHSMTVKGTDTTYATVDTSKTEMLKMFNSSHFSFFNHDKSKGGDSLNRLFVSGAGTYTLKGDKYTENLDFLNYRDWEGKQFHFKLEFRGDTLIQTGEEVIPELGINQTIRETYVKVK